MITNKIRLMKNIHFSFFIPANFCYIILLECTLKIEYLSLSTLVSVHAARPY